MIRNILNLPPILEAYEGPDSSPTAAGFWMRPMRFAGLHRVVRLFAGFADGVTVGEANEAITRHEAYTNSRPGPPSRTTLYHARNTLLHLGAIRRVGNTLRINTDMHEVRCLLAAPEPTGDSLDPRAREAFCNLVLANADCQRNFFELFGKRARLVTGREFRKKAHAVTWRPTQRGKKHGVIVMKGEATMQEMALQTPFEIRSIVYGLRYWARDELHLVDEYFLVGQGSVLFAIIDDPMHVSSSGVRSQILSMVRTEVTWTTLSIQELIRRCCHQSRRPLRALFSALDELVTEYPGYLSLIPTSRGFATVASSADLPSVQRHELQRSYYNDSRGRLISHIRFHESLLKVQRGRIA